MALDWPGCDQEPITDAGTASAGASRWQSGQGQCTGTRRRGETGTVSRTNHRPDHTNPPRRVLRQCASVTLSLARGGTVHPLIPRWSVSSSL